MEFEPYKKLVKSIVLQQLTQSGWVELVRIPISEPEKATPEKIQRAIEQVHRLLYRSEKLELSVQEGVQLCLLVLEKNSTAFRVCASYYDVEIPKLVA